MLRPEFLATEDNKAAFIALGVVGGLLVGLFEEIGWTGFAIPPPGLATSRRLGMLQDGVAGAVGVSSEGGRGKLRLCELSSRDSISRAGGSAIPTADHSTTSMSVSRSDTNPTTLSPATWPEPDGSSTSAL
jgi:hypothetical protein